MYVMNVNVTNYAPVDYSFTHPILYTNPLLCDTI